MIWSLFQNPVTNKDYLWHNISIAWLFDNIILEYVNLLGDHDHEF